MNLKKVLNRLIQKARLALVAIGLWGLRHIADKRLSDALPYVFDKLDRVLIAELKKSNPVLDIDTAIKAAISEVTDDIATPDQVAIVRAVFDPKFILNGLFNE